MPSPAPQLTDEEMAAVIKRGREAERLRQRQEAESRQSAGQNNIVRFPGRPAAKAPTTARPNAANAGNKPSNILPFKRPATPAAAEPIQRAPLVEEFGPEEILPEGPQTAEQAAHEEEEEGEEDEENQENKKLRNQEIKKTQEPEDEFEPFSKPIPEEYQEPEAGQQEQQLNKDKEEARRKREQEEPASDEGQEKPGQAEKTPAEPAPKGRAPEGQGAPATETPMAAGQPGGPLGQEAREAKEAEQAPGAGAEKPAAGEGATGEAGAAKAAGAEAGPAGGGVASAQAQARNALAREAQAGAKAGAKAAAGAAEQVAKQVAAQAAKRAIWYVIGAIGSFVAANLFWILPLVLILILVAIVYYASQNCTIVAQAQMAWNTAFAYYFSNGASLNKAINIAAGCITK